MKARSLALLCSATLLAGCSHRPGLDPATSPVVTGERRVTYFVRCESCTAQFTTMPSTERQEVEGSWSRTVAVDARSVSVVSLSVHPTASHRPILRARIEIDGRRVAESGEGGASVDGVTLTAMIQPHAPGGATRVDARRLR